MEIEPAGEGGDAVKLTVTHVIEREGSRLIAAVSGGWPQILSNLKSLLETGTVVLGSRAQGAAAPRAGPPAAQSAERAGSEP